MKTLFNDECEVIEKTTERTVYLWHRDRLAYHIIIYEDNHTMNQVSGYTTEGSVRLSFTIKSYEFNDLNSAIAYVLATTL